MLKTFPIYVCQRPDRPFDPEDTSADFRMALLTAIEFAPVGGPRLPVLKGIEILKDGKTVIAVDPTSGAAVDAEIEAYAKANRLPLDAAMQNDDVARLVLFAINDEMDRHPLDRTKVPETEWTVLQDETAQESAASPAPAPLKLVTTVRRKPARRRKAA